VSEEPIFFPSPAAFRKWLAKNHDRADVLWVGFYKVGTGKPSLTWDQAVDEALCHGWIDGVRRGIDEERYKIRFTPRRARSVWSKKNIASVERLTGAGRMQPAGLAAFAARTAKRSGTYSFEQEQPAGFGPELERAFRAKPKAWKHFQTQPPGYRRLLTHWVTSAKKEETRLRRLRRIIEVSGRGERVNLLSPFGKEG
jgi:uncharacterized protein YdeI (YjbR/CyaY-like superfamily)